MGWFRQMSLRGRLMLIGTGGLAIGLLLGGLVLVSVLRVVLDKALDSGARRTAADVIDLIDANGLVNPVPTAGTQFVQVIDDHDRVLAASITADRLNPLLHHDELARARRGHTVVIGGDRVGLGGDLRVVAEQSGARTVLVAAPQQDITQSLETVAHALLVAYPLLLGTLAALAWWVVGWTLRPVEQLRRGAEEISAAQVGRLPVPDGEDELHRLALTLNRMLDRLEAARSRQRAFIADAAHELRSPIASLRTQLDVASHLGEPPPLADLSADVDRLNRLVSDLLLLARADEGDPGLRRRQPVELGALLAEVAAAYAGARVPVTVRPDGPQWTDGDPVALRRVVDNLVGNAVRHASSVVKLALQPLADQVVLTVTDDGPGIPESDRSRVFDRFTRLDDARTRDDGGAGLGLAIVGELVRLHGGTVILGDAAPGLRVAVALLAGEPPRSEEPAGAGAQPGGAGAPPGAGAQPAGQAAATDPAEPAAASPPNRPARRVPPARPAAGRTGT
jgi:signal transduction histidine kinase